VAALANPSRLKGTRASAQFIMSTRVTRNVYKWLINAQYWILPGTCIVCKRSSNRPLDLCLECDFTLPPLHNPCFQCGLPLPAGYQGRLCGTCMVTPPPWTRLIAPFSYQLPLPVLISGFKYQGKLVAGRVLTTRLQYHLQREYRNCQWPSLILPVPLHGSRIRQRGFNQALEIARPLAKKFALPLLTNSVRRTRKTEQQTGLSANARKLNMRGAFHLECDLAFEPGTTIAIVDDVVTTGVTTMELARVLRKAGVSEVHVWALARTVL